MDLQKPDTNKPVFQIFPKAKENIERTNHHCAWCGNLITILDFRDERSKKEYSISGMCQKCQDKIFGA